MQENPKDVTASTDREMSGSTITQIYIYKYIFLDKHLPIWMKGMSVMKKWYVTKLWHLLNILNDKVAYIFDLILDILLHF